jgi:hypothetical protein
MLVLFDNGTPRTLARYLIGHQAVSRVLVCLLRFLPGS